MTLDPELEPCDLLEPLCRLLEENPGLEREALTPSEWARRVGPYMSEEPGKPKVIGYGVFARCMWRHRDLLAKRLIVTQIENPDNQAHLYEIRLRPCSSAEGCEDVVCVVG